MSEQTARDVMNPSPTVLAASDTVAKGIELIMRHRYRNIPIIDPQGCYLGVFGVHCLLSLMLPQAALMERGLEDISFISDDLGDLRQRLKEVEDQPVTICLSDEAKVISPDTPLLETLLVLYHSRLSVPVVDPNDRRLLGMISYWDVGQAVLAQGV